MEYTDLPENLYSAIGSESKDFAVKARSVKPLRKSMFGLIFGISWLAFTSVFIFTLLGSDNQPDASIQATSAEVSSTVPFWPMFIFFGVFILTGLIILGSAIIPTLRSGGYFVGTPARLIHYKNKRLRSIDWEQFTGDIEVRGSSKKGSITLLMRTGKLISKSKGGTQYVPDIIDIANIPEVYDIEKIIRRRIRENDPTPARS